MRFRLEAKWVVTILALLVAFLGSSTVASYGLVRDQALRVKADELEADFQRYLHVLENFTQDQQQKAQVVAHLGEWLYVQARADEDFDIRRSAMDVLLAAVSSTGEQDALLGCGLWYEPDIFGGWVGPYATVDSRGRATPNWEYSTDAYDYPKRGWYTIAVPSEWDRTRPRPRDLYMTEPYLDSLEGQPTVFVSFTQVMYSPERRIIGVGTADWTFDSLARQLSEFRITPSSFAILVHGPSRKVLFPVGRDELHTVDELPWGTQLPLNDLEVGDVQRLHELELEQGRYDVIYTRTKAGFIFGLFIATDEAYAFVDDIARRNLTLALAVLILGAFGAYVAGRRLTRPIRALAQDARRISAGHLDHRARVTSKDELGELAESFNTAYQRVRDYATALEEKTVELERQNLEREQAEARLRASERWFRALIENAKDVIAVLEPDMTLRYASPSVQRVLGVSAAELVGESLLRLLHEDDAASNHAALRRLLQGTSQVEVFEARLQHRTGQWRVLEIVAAPYEDDAQFLIVLNARDITDRKEAQRALADSEEQLRQSQKLEAVGRLAGGIAHDFNNAMTAVIGVTDLLLLRHQSNPDVAPYLEEIRSAGEHAAALTRQLLAFSRRHVVEPRPLDLNVIVVDVKQMLRRLIGEDIELVTELTTIPAIRADRRHVEQMLVNLAVNARDAMPNGGRIHIHTYRLELQEPRLTINGRVAPGEYVALSVSDTGTGMTPETLAHAFDPFFTTKEVGEGTGLGLSTVYGIVEQSDGHILVDSTPGVGTTFTIFWPSITATVPHLRDRTVAPPAATGEVVMLIEDDDRVRAVTVSALRAAGYTVCEASKPGEALEVLRSPARVDALITDVVMPEIKGPELARRARQHRPELPVLFISGYAAGELDSVEDERQAFLQKPFSPAQLGEALHALLEPSESSRQSST